MALTHLLASEEATLSIKLENKRPVELLDLTASFHALGEQYRDFVYERGYDPVAENVRLYITELRTGSILAELKAIADQASFVMEHREVLAAFLVSFNDVMQFFLTMSGPARPESISRQDAERTAQIIEPVAKDHGSQIIMQINGSPGAVINNYIFTSEQAAVAQNNIRRFLGPSLALSGPFTKEVLTLHQVRGDTSKRGDRGIIERFGTKPVKLEIMNDEAKREILDRDDNPFRLAFVVDGAVSTVDGKPAMYKIYTVHETMEKPD